MFNHWMQTFWELTGSMVLGWTSPRLCKFLSICNPPRLTLLHYTLIISSMLLVWLVALALCICNAHNPNRMPLGGRFLQILGQFHDGCKCNVSWPSSGGSQLPLTLLNFRCNRRWDGTEIALNTNFCHLEMLALQATTASYHRCPNSHPHLEQHLAFASSSMICCKFLAFYKFQVGVPSFFCILNFDPSCMKHIKKVTLQEFLQLLSLVILRTTKFPGKVVLIY